MPNGARHFVLLAFSILALAFIAETASLVYEFSGTDWVSFATHDSHTFLFFPTLGILALAAFYAPATAITGIYWTHVWYGRLRYSLGFVALVGLSLLVAASLNASPFRSVWEIAPHILTEDASEPDGCGGIGKPPCQRIGLLDALENVSIVSQSRLGLIDFVQKCEADNLMEPPAEPERKRFCFASSPLNEKPQLSTAADCCRAQARLQKTIAEYYTPEANRSMTSAVHAIVLPFKVFFLLMLGVISVLLAVRHKSVARLYPENISAIDLGVVVGAIAMTFFPLMSQAFVETADALFGTAQNEGFKPIVPFMSFAFGGWALLLLMFFYRRHDREVEFAGKIAGLLASAIAIVKYDLIIALINRFLGSGAGTAAIGLLLILAISGALVLASPVARQAVEPETPAKR